MVLQRLRREGLAEPGRLAGFLCGTARKLELAERRRSFHHRGEASETALSETENPAPSPLKTVLASEAKERVDRLIHALSTERDRQLLRRFYLTEEDRERICADLGLERLHFNRVLFRARRRLQELAGRRSLLLSDAAMAGGH